MYTVIFLTQAQKDAKKLGASGLKEKALSLINLIQQDPPINIHLSMNISKVI